ncbi:hypothetical protein HJC23_011239 [Cyclotella cryptica]|uniref:E2F/DP family winged-helix DNA-binding domain-containing protein n=1 Tax=Cyclotella cryptica TaxID=29204 RepID=A0ABD3QYT5_9STRA
MAPRPYQPQWRHVAHITPYTYSYPTFVVPYSVGQPNPNYNPQSYYCGDSSGGPNSIATHYSYNMSTDQGNVFDADARRPCKKSKLDETRDFDPIPDVEQAAAKPKSLTPPGKGLRHFSMKICEKVKGKGTTTYNEVADELIRELRKEEARIYLASVESSSAGKKKRLKPPQSKYDEKNIRRRVYDALNVLMAMDIIVKDKKMIVWNGLPGKRVSKTADTNSTSQKHGLGGNVQSKKSTERCKDLNEERLKRQAEIQRKREILQELVTQSVCFNNLYERNHAREIVDMSSQSSRDEIGYAQDNTDEKIPLPFIVVNTNHKSVIQCEMCPERTNVTFDFTSPFEINDDNAVLKRIGM